MVAPMPQQNGEAARPVVADPPTQPANPQRHERPVVADPPNQVEAPPQEEATTTNSEGHSAATAVVIVDSDIEISD